MKDLEISSSELSNLIDEWVIGKNAERDREILKSSLILGRSQYQLAEQFCLSQTQIKTILKKRKQQLFNHISLN